MTNLLNSEKSKIQNINIITNSDTKNPIHLDKFNPNNQYVLVSAEMQKPDRYFISNMKTIIGHRIKAIEKLENKVIKLIIYRLIISNEPDNQKIKDKEILSQNVNTFFKENIDSIIKSKHIYTSLEKILEKDLELKESSPNYLKKMIQSMRIIKSKIESCINDIQFQLSNDTDSDKSVNENFKSVCDNIATELLNDVDQYKNIKINTDIQVLVVNKNTPTKLLDVANNTFLVTSIDYDNKMNSKLKNLIDDRRKVASEKKQQQREKKKIEENKIVNEILNLDEEQK